MSHRLACELSDHIAAVAPVGAPYEDIACAPSRAVAILFVHGTGPLRELMAVNFAADVFSGSSVQDPAPM